MKKILLLLFSFLQFSQFFCLAQTNLVPNPSFEILTGCDSLAGGFDYSISPPWNSPNTASPDLLNPCSTFSGLGVPVNFFGYQFPHTGNGYAGAGFFQLGGDNYREYIQVRLDSLLIAQHKYCTTFYVSLSSVYACASNNIGVYFSNSQTSVNGQNRLNYIPQILDTNIISDTLNWSLISGEFIASGGEQYIIIGNFNTAATTNTLALNSSIDSYYFIDDVSIVDCTGSGLGLHDLEDNNKFILSPNPSTALFTISSAAKINQIKITNMLGEVIKTINNSTTIDLTEYTNGIYFAEIKSEKGITNKKLIKQ